MPKKFKSSSSGGGLVSTLLPILLQLAGPILSKRGKARTYPSKSKKSKKSRNPSRKTKSKKGRGARVGGAFVNSNVLAPRTTRFATPASFAKIESNTTFISAERPVTHPSLGIAGVRFHGRQPLTAVAPNTNTAGAPSSQFWTVEGPAQTWPLAGAGTVVQTYIDLTPSVLGFGGPLATRASLYQRYRFTSIRIVYTSACGTDTQGQGGMAIIEDPGAPQSVADTYQTLREVEPHVTFPYRVPEAQLNWMSRNTTLYYVFDVDSVAIGPDTVSADTRQCKQGTLVGFDSGLVVAPPGAASIPTLGYADLEYEIEFYDPVPPNSSVSARNGAERELIKAVLSNFRGDQQSSCGHSYPRPVLSPAFLSNLSSVVNPGIVFSDPVPISFPPNSTPDQPPTSAAPVSCSVSSNPMSSLPRPAHVSWASTSRT